MHTSTRTARAPVATDRAAPTSGSSQGEEALAAGCAICGVGARDAVGALGEACCAGACTVVHADRVAIEDASISERRCRIQQRYSEASLEVPALWTAACAWGKLQAMAEDRDMGTTFIIGKVSGPKASGIDVKFLVDSGAHFSVLPNGVWRQIGLRPTRTERFILADGSEIRRSISEALFSLPQGETHSPVVLGEPGDVALLGVLTLEALGLMLNPLDRTLQPMTLRL